jgi:uncharacterized protein YndB with AHSA1/START domain
MAPIRVEHTAVLQHPVATVFAAASDPLLQLEWDAVTLRRVEEMSDGPLGVGTRYRGRLRGLGEVDYEIAAFERDRRLVHIAALPMGELEHSFVFDAAPEGTRLAQTGELRPSVLGQLGAPLMRRMLEHRFAAIASGIDAYLRRRSTAVG